MGYILALPGQQEAATADSTKGKFHRKTMGDGNILIPVSEIWAIYWHCLGNKRLLQLIQPKEKFHRKTMGDGNILIPVSELWAIYWHCLGNKRLLQRIQPKERFHRKTMGDGNIPIPVPNYGLYIGTAWATRGCYS